ncbi:MAG: hypothetical protein WAO41_02395 [Candidatus Nanopelagicales bacterium]
MTNADEGQARDHAVEPAVQQRFPVAADPAGIKDVRVRAAVDLLDDLEQLPLDEHPAVYTDIHQRLTQALGAPSDQ